MFTNKKASIEWNLTTLGGIIIAALVGITLFQLVDVYIHPEKIESTLLAKNVALELEAMQASPYDLIYQHPVSLQTRNLVLEENSVKVVARNDAPARKIDQLTTFHEYYFLTSQDFVLPSEAVIDAGLVVLTKQGNTMLVHDGTATFADVTAQATGLTDVKIAITTNPQSSGDANILTNIAQGLRSHLQQQRIPVVSESEATIIIELSFSSSTEHIIYYSTINSDAVKLLATNTRQILQPLVTFLIGGAQDYTYLQATLDVSFGLQHPDFSTLKDSGTQRNIALALATAIEQTYPSAAQTLNP